MKDEIDVLLRIPPMQFISADMEERRERLRAELSKMQFACVCQLICQTHLDKEVVVQEIEDSGEFEPREYLGEAVFARARLPESEAEKAQRDTETMAAGDRMSLAIRTLKEAFPDYVPGKRLRDQSAGEQIRNALSRAVRRLAAHPEVPPYWSSVRHNPASLVFSLYSVLGDSQTVKEYLTQGEFLMDSTFISYGRPDERFANALNDALSKSGVETFFFPLHATPGVKLHREMRRLNDYDRVILVCSRNALDRPGVLNEIEETLQREARNGGAEYLIPITLDRYVYEEWNPPRPDLRQSVLDRVVADFSKSADDRVDADALARLLRALRRSLSADVKARVN